MSLVDSLYLVGLAGICGYVLVGRVPSVLHVPLLSGANFIHGLVLVGAILVFTSAEGGVARTIGFVAMVLGSANAVGGLLLTERLFALFERGRSGRRGASDEARPGGRLPGDKRPSDGRPGDGR